MSTTFENQFERAEKLAKQLDSYDDAAVEDRAPKDVEISEPVAPKHDNTRPKSRNALKYLALIACIAVAVGMLVRPTTTTAPIPAPAKPEIVRVFAPTKINDIPPGIKATSDAQINTTPHNTMRNDVFKSLYSRLEIKSWRLDIDAASDATTKNRPTIDFTSSIEVDLASNAAVPMNTKLYVMNIDTGVRTALKQTSCSVEVSGKLNTSSCTAELIEPLSTGSYQLQGKLVTSAAGISSASSITFGAGSR